MTDSPAPDGVGLPETPVGMRSRPSDVVANPPVTKTPSGSGVAPALPGTTARPGVPQADNAGLAVERATRIAAVADDAAAERTPLSTDQIMPTCMIYAMFAVLALLAGIMLFWGVAAFGTLHLHF